MICDGLIFSYHLATRQQMEVGKAGLISILFLVKRSELLQGTANGPEAYRVLKIRQSCWFILFFPFCAKQVFFVCWHYKTQTTVFERDHILVCGEGPQFL